MKRGFTLLEMLVAALLLGMLVSVLTMIFNSSAVAWRTGAAGVRTLNETRRQIGTFHDVRDNILPGLGGTGYGTSRDMTFRTVSLWQKNSDQLRTDRAYDRVEWGTAPTFSLGDAAKGAPCAIQGGQTVGGSLFTVGVRSAGPNREFGDEDDITTWPDDVF